MKPNLFNREKNFRKKFLFLFSLFCFLSVALLVFQEWHNLRAKELARIEQSTLTLAFRINAMFTMIENSLGTIPFYAEDTESCAKIRPKLESAVLNNLYISGVSLSDKNNKIWCSTLSFAMNLPPIPSDDRTLNGPIDDPNTTRDFFVIQQGFPTFNITVYIVNTVFETLFRMNSDIFDFMGLYDIEQKKMILKYGDEPVSSPFSYQAVMIAPHFIGEDVVEASIPLYKLKNIRLVTQFQDANLLRQLFSSLLLFSLPLILFFVLTYYSAALFLKKQFSVEHAIKMAIQKKQFLPFYQPIRNEIKARFDGAEVLVRWKNDFGGIIMPDDFIEAAEQSGLILPMTHQLIETALLECETFLHTYPDFHLSFNFTPHHFRDENFIPAFIEQLKTKKIQPSQIMIEVTERELFDKKDISIVGKMERLRNMGFSIALDDFGTGQANINYLHHFPFNVLKIDKMFVSSIGTGAITEELNLGIITMAKSLNLEVIAEGVETKIQREYLVKHGVNFIQGWLYARAMPAGEFIDFIKKDRT